MDHLSAEAQLSYTGINIGPQVSHRMRTHVQSSTHMGCFRKREMVAGHPINQFRVKHESPQGVLKGADWVAVSNCQADAKYNHHQRILPEVEAGGWLRDEPVDVGPHASEGLVRSSSAFKGCGTGDIVRSLRIGGAQFSAEALVSPSMTQSSDLPGTPTAQPGGSCSTSHLYAELRARLRATKVRESVIRDAIQRLGGGQKGLRAVIKVILFWLRERSRSSSQADDACDLGKVIDELVWCNAGSFNMDSQFPSLRSSGHPEENFNLLVSGDINHMMRSMPSCSDGGGSGSFCDTKLRCEPRKYDDQSDVLGEPGKSGGLLGSIGMQGLITHDSDAILMDASPIPSGCWVSSGIATKNLHQLSPSSECSRLLKSPDITVFDEVSPLQNKIRRLAPFDARNTSSCGSADSSAYQSSTIPPPASDFLEVPNVSGSVVTNPFASGGPFSLSPSSPACIDPNPLDTGPFTSWLVLIDEHLGSTHECGLMDSFGSSGAVYPLSPESSRDPDNSVGLGVGMLTKAKASPSASTRLARKNRMDRNRKVASNHSTRAASVATHAAVTAGGTSLSWPFASSGPVCCMPQSQTSPAPSGQSSVKDRKDHEHLLFLLQKVLRPSDVGNLGRIVLPKKDAESHLPWLGAREGVQFACEDYHTGEKMMLRYRFWPNNKSRMYLLENTGDFVKKHQLQESDRLLIYRNQQHGTYIIRCRKARDCLDRVPVQVQAEEGREVSRQSSPMGACSSGESSNDRDGESSKIAVDSDIVPPPELVVSTDTAIVTPQDDLLDFADLPDAPMGEGAENLVRFPSLEAFDVEMLELACVATDKQNARCSRSSPGAANRHCGSSVLFSTVCGNSLP